MSADFLSKRHVVLQDELPIDTGLSPEEMYQFVLNTDLRKKILIPTLPSDISSRDDSVLAGPCFLQINNIANVSMPLRRQGENSNPRLLLLKLTDGYTKVTALEYSSLESAKISPSCPPGTKVGLNRTTYCPSAFNILTSIPLC